MISFKQDRLNKLFQGFVLVATLMSMLLYTDPNNIPLPLLVVPFLLIGLIVHGVTKLIIDRLALKSKSFAVRLLPISLAFMIVSMLLLRSLHQLTLKDSVLVCGFTVAFWLYVWRADFLHK